MISSMLTNLGLLDPEEEGTLCSTKIKRPDISYILLRQSRAVKLSS